MIGLLTSRRLPDPSGVHSAVEMSQFAAPWGYGRRADRMVRNDFANL